MTFITLDIVLDSIIYKVLIGKNAKGNETIIKMSEPNDLWFHFADISGPHLVLKNDFEDSYIIPKKHLYKIASTLFNYKKCTNSIKILYTTINNVKLTKTIGTVITKNTKILKLN